MGHPDWVKHWQLSNVWNIEQQLIRCQMLSKSLSGEEIARKLVDVLCVTYGVKSKYVLGAMRDKASMNNIANCYARITYPSVVDMGCFLHTIDHVGECSFD